MDNIKLEPKTEPEDTKLSPERTVPAISREAWPESRVPENWTICQSEAMSRYHLGSHILNRLRHVKGKNKHNARTPMKIYNEREVERLAWERYGGPEGFNEMLNVKEKEFKAKPSNEHKKFPRPRSFFYYTPFSEVVDHSTGECHLCELTGRMNGIRN